MALPFFNIISMNIRSGMCWVISLLTYCADINLDSQPPLFYILPIAKQISIKASTA